MTTETAFCINCGEEIEADAGHCPECGASQNLDELEVEGDSANNASVVNKGSSGPFGMPKDVYHNENWRRVKIAVVLPILLQIPMFISVAISQPISEDPNLANYSLVLITIAVFFIGSIAAYIGFIIYASRDKRVLHDECGQSSKRSPVLIAIFFIFTSGLYSYYYVIMRNHRYEIDEVAGESSS